MGANRIRNLDTLFILNLPRWIFAVWCKVDEDRWLIYSKMRLFTFWIQWLAGLGTLIAMTIMTAVKNEVSNADLYYYAFGGICGLLIVAVVDFHFTQVVSYFASEYTKKKKREEKERAKRQRAEERFRKHTNALNIPDGDENAIGRPSLSNPVKVGGFTV